MIAKVSEPRPTVSPSNNPILIAGPTGSGKSEFAVELALRVGGEILCADAFQIYRGLEILTAQPTPRQLAMVPHHLFGSFPLSKQADAASYAETLEHNCTVVAARGKTPILVGGTGLYLKAFTHGLDDVPPTNPRLRQELASLPLPELIARLTKHDPEAPAEIDCQNPRRVARALEIVESSGKPLRDFRSAWETPKRTYSGILLLREKDDLRERIRGNIERQFSRGVLEEIRALPDGIEQTAAGKAIGLRTIKRFLAGGLAEKECREAIFLDSWHYAKRQLTWFRKQKGYHALAIPPGASSGQLVEITLSLLREAPPG